MTKLDHERPILKLVDRLKRQRAQELGQADPGNDTNGVQQSSLRPFQPSSLAQIRKDVRSWSACSSNDARTDIHQAACSLLAHVGKNHDARLVTWFIGAIPRGHTRSVKDWFELFGPISFDGDKANYNPLNPPKLGDAMDAPFWRLRQKR